MAHVKSIKRHAGIAGEYAYTAVVEYDGEGPQEVTFKGSVYGGPILMVTPVTQAFVSESVLDRIGHKLDAQWVEEFFA
jgi:hypothetical protein